MIDFSWDPVELDCLGMPESGVSYEVSYMYRKCDAWWLDGDDPIQPFCSALVWKRVQQDTSFETLGEDPPPVGAAYWYEVVSIDGAGNRSDSCLN